MGKITRRTKKLMTSGKKIQLGLIVSLTISSLTGCINPSKDYIYYRVADNNNNYDADRYQCDLEQSMANERFVFWENCMKARGYERTYVGD